MNAIAAMPILLLIVACTPGEPKPSPVVDACAAAPRDGWTFGEASLDALVSLHRDPTDKRAASVVEDAAGPPRALFATDVDALAPGTSRDLAELLEAAARTSPESVPLAARIVLQNDVWGLWQRLQRRRVSNRNTTLDLDRLLRASARLVVVLAPPAGGSFRAADPAEIPPTAQALLPSNDGWRELGTDLLVLSHERLFGLRRAFRIFVREPPVSPTSQGKLQTLERALVSQLVAVAPDGTPMLTSIVGEIERLSDMPDSRSASPLSAQVLELERRALRCQGESRSLVEPSMIHGVPGLGANRYLATFEPPAAPTGAVCVRCHDQGIRQSNSLSSDQGARLAERWRPLWDEVRESLAPLVDDGRD